MKTNFSFKSISSVHSFLVSNGSPCLLFCLRAGTSSSLNLCRPCACWRSLYAHMCINPLVTGRHCFLGALHPLGSLHSFYFFLHEIPWALRGEAGRKYSSKDWMSQNFSLSIHCPVVVFYASSFPLQYEASRTMLEWDTDLWVQWIAVPSNFSFSRTTTVFAFPLSPWPI